MFILGCWFQLMSGLIRQGSGVAFWAHIGGFAAGFALVLLFRRPDYVAAHRAQERVARLEASVDVGCGSYLDADKATLTPFTPRRTYSRSA